MVLASWIMAQVTAPAPTYCLCSENPLAPGELKHRGPFGNPPMAEILLHTFTFICGVSAGCILASYIIKEA